MKFFFFFDSSIQPVDAAMALWACSRNQFTPVIINSTAEHKAAKKMVENHDQSNANGGNGGNALSASVTPLVCAKTIGEEWRPIQGAGKRKKRRAPRIQDSSNENAPDPDIGIIPLQTPTTTESVTTADPDPTAVPDVSARCSPCLSLDGDKWATSVCGTTHIFICEAPIMLIGEIDLSMIASPIQNEHIEM